LTALRSLSPGAGVQYSTKGLVRCGKCPRVVSVSNVYGNVSGSKLFAFGPGAAGEIIADSEFYEPPCHRRHRARWTSEHFLVHERGTVDGSRSVFTGELWRLVHRFEFSGSAPETVVLRCFRRSGNPVENSATITQSSVAGMPAVEAFNTNASRFPACGMHFVLTREVRELIVTITTDVAPIPRHIETRFEEALQFVLAHPVSWTILERSAGKNGSVEIRSLPQPENSAATGGAADFISPRVGRRTKCGQMCARYLATFRRTSRPRESLVPPAQRPRARGARSEQSVNRCGSAGIERGGWKAS